MIETIEFVLGCISNTASYLRLWALSLAHSQLAETFLTQLLQKGWSGSNGPNTSVASIMIITFILWFPYMAVTWGVLMMMDALECFLHTLRLHWVEFQNKFFKGKGHAYTPFDFKTTFKEEMER
jgi:V-type H+-transporting ATPase subunit a